MRITLAINNITSSVRNDLENENFLNRAYVRPVALTIWLLHDKVLLNVAPRLTAFTSYLIGVWFIYNFGFLPITKHFDFLGFIPIPFPLTIFHLVKTFNYLYGHRRVFQLRVY